ncbi:MarR family winged helix-turn-helix transcriptional regulator [Paenibacillus chartarius]|uniref:MarR family winged helix-turn-helix transcriptional regulator n=1 Tax=Paenibacillus chartarius TaxID=747481 RepID=A0ABV6DEP3_9BACL
MHNQSELGKQLALVFGQLRRSILKGKAVQDLKANEFQFLAALDVLAANEHNGQGVKISAVSSAFRITQAAATHKLKALEEKGYVIRTESTEDKRVSLVRPTPKGERLVAAEEERYLEQFAGLAARLGERDGAELLRLLERTMAYFQEREANE